MSAPGRRSWASPDRGESGSARTQPGAAIRRDNPPLGRIRIIAASDGVRLSLRDYGSRAPDHTVVLLHGLCLDQSSWDIQIGQLIREWGNDIRIISYDHRGHGDSADAPLHTYRI